MKKLFKRVICMVLALCMLAMVGCGQPNDGTSGTTASTTPTTKPSSGEHTLPKEEGYNQLTIYWDYDGDLSTASFWI